MSDLEYLEFELDSKDAVISLNAYSKLDWPKFQLGRRLQNIIGVKILEAQIPFTYYTFETGFNTFTVEGTGTNFSITVPEGNYSLTQLLPVLKTLLDAYYNEWSWTVTVGAYNRKLTLVNTYTVPSPTVQLGNFKVYSDNPMMQQLLGIADSSASATLSTQVGVVFTLNCPNAINLSGPNYLYCNSLAIGSQCDVFLPQGQVFNGNVTPTLAKIPVTVNSGGLIRWQDPSPQNYFDLENLYNISELDFYLTYPNSTRVIKLNGQSFSLKVGLIIKTDSHSVTTSSQFQTRRVVKRIRRQ